MKHSFLSISKSMMIWLTLSSYTLFGQLPDCEKYGSAEVAMADLYIDLADLALDIVSNCTIDFEACNLAYDFLYRVEDILTVVFNGHSTGGCIDCDLSEMIGIAYDLQPLSKRLNDVGRSNRFGNILYTLLDYKDLTCGGSRRSPPEIEISSPDFVNSTDRRGKTSSSKYPCTPEDMKGQHDARFTTWGSSIKLYRHGDVFCNNRGGWFLVLEASQIVKYEIDRSRNEYLPKEYHKIVKTEPTAKGPRIITDKDAWLTLL